MPRSSRLLPLLRPLMLAAGALAGCAAPAAEVLPPPRPVAVVESPPIESADEDDPGAHVKRLEDPATAPAAVNRLLQLYEDAMVRDNKDRSGPAVKALLDRIIAPLNQRCVSGGLDERTGSRIIKLISDARDLRGEPCLIKTLADYKPGSTEEDIRWACRGIGAMRSKAAAGPLLGVFTRLRASSPNGGLVYRDVHDAMLAVSDRSWESQLIATLDRPIQDRKDIAALKDELFWQITAAELLGAQRSERGVVPLLRVVLSPLKVDAATTAILALVKIGKPAVAPAVALLKGEPKELVALSRSENLKVVETPSKEQTDAAETAHIGMAALILGTIGREEVARPLIDALARAKDPVRAIIARELSKVPRSPETLKAFKTAYEKTPITLTIPPGMGAREALLESAAMFFDPSLVPWIVKTALAAQGDEEDVAPVRDASLATAIKLMTPAQVAEVDKLYRMRQTGPDGNPSTVGKAFENEYKLSKDLLQECGTDAACYLVKVSEPASQQQTTQFKGIKAAYMLGVLGKPELRQKIVDVMPKITNAAVRYVTASALDALSPSGDPVLARKLQAFVDEAAEKRDTQMMAANGPLKTVIYRLDARAE